LSSSELLGISEDISGGLSVLASFEDIGGLAKALAKKGIQGGAEAGAEAAGNISKEASKMIDDSIGFGYGDFVGKAAAVLNGMVGDFVTNHYGKIGGMIVVDITCGKCVCVDPWWGDSYNELQYDDPKRYFYMVKKVGNDIVTRKAANLGLVKPLDEITLADIEMARRKASEEAGCNKK